MSNQKIKLEGVQYLRSWLLEERGETTEGRKIRNLDLLPDEALVMELIQFNLDGNFDRVMGLIGCIIGLEERYNQYDLAAKKEKTALEKSLNFFAKNKNILKLDKHDARNIKDASTASFYGREIG